MVQFIYWSSMTLHGAKALDKDMPRISLRYTIKKNKNNKNKVLIDKLIDSAKNKKALEIMRDDFDWNSKNYTQTKFNKILK